jgi:hypothetical protein
MAIRQSASYEAYVTNLAEDCELGDDVACDTVSSEDQAKAAWLETVAGSWGSAQTLSEAPVYTGETKKMEYEMEAKAPFDLTDALSNFRREDLSDALSGATSTVTGATKKLVENRGPFASELTSELAGATKSFTKKLVDLRAPLSQPAKTALNATVGLLKNVGMSVVMSEWSEKHMAETGEIYKDLSVALGQLTGELRGSMSTAAEEPEVRARMEKVNKAAGDLFRRPRARD